MTEYEVRDHNRAVRVLAEDELEALETAIAVDPELQEGNVYPADGVPVGIDGDDAP